MDIRKCITSMATVCLARIKGSLSRNIDLKGRAITGQNLTGKPTISIMSSSSSKMVRTKCFVVSYVN